MYLIGYLYLSGQRKGNQVLIIILYFFPNNNLFFCDFHCIIKIYTPLRFINFKTCVFKSAGSYILTCYTHIISLQI